MRSVVKAVDSLCLANISWLFGLSFSLPVTRFALLTALPVHRACTSRELFSSSVISFLSTVSTGPITTATNYLNKPSLRSCA